MYMLVAAGVAIGATAGSSTADTVTLQPAKDNTLISNGISSNGQGQLFSGRTGTNGQGTILRAVMAFDVACAGIPQGSTITGATLTLTLYGVSGGASDETHTLHTLLADWGEGESLGGGGQGAPPTEGDATWDNTFFPDQFWTVAGGDFAAAASADTVVPQDAPALCVWGSTVRMQNDVQRWLDDPAVNYGWLLMGNEDDLFTARRFASRENQPIGEQPTLVIEFDPPSCGADLNGDATVDVVDLLDLIAGWETTLGDLDGDCVTDVVDLLEVLGAWGPCP